MPTQREAEYGSALLVRVGGKSAEPDQVADIPLHDCEYILGSGLCNSGCHGPSHDLCYLVEGAGLER
ncbi:hypothetical protein ABZY07_42045 [Streptomyces tauricus]